VKLPLPLAVLIALCAATGSREPRHRAKLPRLAARQPATSSPEAVVADEYALERQIARVRDMSATYDEAISRLKKAVNECESLVPRLLEGKVLEVVVPTVCISIGRDDGVREGTEFGIYRNGRPIGKLAVDQVELRRAWGRLTRWIDEPQISDDVTNSVLLTD
jgi:hypothetical protein